MAWKPLNPEDIRQEIQSLESRESARRQNYGGGGQRELRFYNYDRGVNAFRLLGSGCEKLLGIVVYSHTKILGSDNKYTCVELTFPELNTPCPLMAAIKYIEGNGVKVEGHQLRSRGYTNVVDLYKNPEYKMAKADEEYPYVEIAGFPVNKVYQQLLNMMSSPMIGDLTNPHDAPALVMTMSETGYDYTLSTSPNTPSGPIHPDPKVVDRLIEEAYDLSQIFKPPSDEKMKEMIKLGETMKMHYLQTNYQVPVGAPGYQAAPPPQAIQEDSKKALGQEAPPQTPVPAAAPAPGLTSQSPPQNESPSPPTAPAPTQVETPATSPPQPPGQPTSIPAQTNEAPVRTTPKPPDGSPDCLASKVGADGRLNPGYSNDLRGCKICPFMLPCKNAQAQLIASGEIKEGVTEADRSQAPLVGEGTQVDVPV